MQIRRVLLLFALVLGLSALVASIAPAPDDETEEPPATAVEPPPATAPEPVAPPLKVSAKGSGGPAPTRHVSVGAGFTLQVSVPEPGDVILDGIGLRESADPLNSGPLRRPWPSAPAVIRSCSSRSVAIGALSRGSCSRISRRSRRDSATADDPPAAVLVRLVRLQEGSDDAGVELGAGNRLAGAPPARRCGQCWGRYTRSVVIAS